MIIYNKTPYKWLPFKIIFWYITVLLVLTIAGPVRYDFDFFYMFLMLLYIGAFFLITWIGMAKSSVYEPYCYASQRREAQLLRWIKITTIITSLVQWGIWKKWRTGRANHSVASVHMYGGCV